jgi:hypothetical protein
MLRLAKILIQLFADMLCLCGLAFRSSRSIKAENPCLRRQLALYIERAMKPRRVDPVTRIALALLSRFFNWRDALVVVRPGMPGRRPRARFCVAKSTWSDSRATASTMHPPCGRPMSGRPETNPAAHHVTPVDYKVLCTICRDHNFF